MSGGPSAIYTLENSGDLPWLDGLRAGQKKKHSKQEYAPARTNGGRE